MRRIILFLKKGAFLEIISFNLPFQFRIIENKHGLILILLFLIFPCLIAQLSYKYSILEANHRLFSRFL